MVADDKVVVEELVKDYPRTRAVDCISLTVDKGEIFGLLGPNGAGKTTTIRIMLTLIKPSSGRVQIFGIDALAHPERIREMAGYVPQDVSIDGELTGYENILMSSKLYGIPRATRKQAITEALQYLDLQDRANHMASTYSGGMMRRLELAQALVNRPRILFLDEPSIGLDPSARRVIWDLIKNLRTEFGATVFINTHDMNEADELCDRIGIMDNGKLVIVGHPSELKSTVGGDVLSIDSASADSAAVLTDLGYQTISKSENGHFDLVVSNGERLIPQLLETLRTRGVEVEAVSLKKPTLDDVFLKYTGARIEDSEGWRQTRQTRRTFRRLSR